MTRTRGIGDVWIDTLVGWFDCFLDIWMYSIVYVRAILYPAPSNLSVKQFKAIINLAS